MSENTINPIKYVAIFLLLTVVIAGLFLLPLVTSKAQNKGSLGASLAGGTLCSTGLGCDQTTATPSSSSTESSKSSSGSGGLFSGLFGGSSKNLVGDPVLTIVSVPGQTAVYRIVNGLRHSIPTTEIFYSYGLTTDMVQEVTPEELAKYPMARLFRLESIGDKNTDMTIYYLTQSGRLRPILNDKVFYSYGDRMEDVITINQKEFNYYPRDQFVFLEQPKINRDIYQISGGIKRYLTPVAVKRMDLREDEISPINQIEFDAYPEGEPVIF